MSLNRIPMVHTRGRSDNLAFFNDEIGKNPDESLLHSSSIRCLLLPRRTVLSRRLDWSHEGAELL